MGDLLSGEAILRSISFILVLFGLDTLRRCKKKPWLAIVGLALIAIYYIQGMFTGLYSFVYVDIGLILMNINLILLYRRTSDPVVNWLRDILNAEVKNPESPITHSDADRIVGAFQRHIGDDKNGQARADAW